MFRLRRDSLLKEATSLFTLHAELGPAIPLHLQLSCLLRRFYKSPIVLDRDKRVANVLFENVILGLVDRGESLVVRHGTIYG